MYVDGYAPSFYWRYSMRYGPSCLDIASWIRANRETLAPMRPPVSRAPPLPAAVACLCMMPITEDGLECLPRRLRPLVEPGCDLREALQWKGVTKGLDVSKILRVMLQEAPKELVQFHKDSHIRCAR